MSIKDFGPYCMTKAAVVSLSQCLKIELAPFNIGVTVLCPSCVNTNVIKYVKENTGMMEYTDGSTIELLQAGFNASKITPEHEAARVLKAVEKNKLYIRPAAPGFAISALNARVMPESYYRMLSFMNKKGLDDPVFMKMAQRGWM